MKEWNGREREHSSLDLCGRPFPYIQEFYMKKQAFSSEKYLNLQRDHIIERINHSMASSTLNLVVRC